MRFKLRDVDTVSYIVGLDKALSLEKILKKEEYCIKNNIPLIRIPYDRLGKITLQDLLLSTSNYLYKGELSTS